MAHNARTVYLDHSVVSYPIWHENLMEILLRKEFRLVVSVWNLVEIGGATDQAQKQHRLDFIEKLNPLWIAERLSLQKQEVRHFLWRNRFDVVHEVPIVITPILSIVDSLMSGWQMRIGLTPKRFIEETSFEELSPLRKISPRSLSTLQTAGTKAVKARRKEIFLAWVGGLMPDCDPTGRAFTRQQKSELAEFCYNSGQSFFDECRSLAVENALTNVRIRDPGRKPRESDGPDLQHIVPALAYCDIFLTRDGYQAQCTEAVRTTLVGMNLALVCTDVEALEGV